jgi:deoxycytidine triphosphate deaminase
MNHALEATATMFISQVSWPFTMVTHPTSHHPDDVIDARKNNEVTIIKIPEEGYVLQPGELYLGVTVEYTETMKCCPFLEGKSSTGRLGISIHV